MDLAEDPEIQRCWDMNAKTWIGHMDLAEDPEIRRCWDMNPKTWTYIRIRRHGSGRGSWDTYGCWDTDPETWILQRSLRYIWMLIYGSGDMDLAEVPEIHVDAETWIRRHGSCRGPWGIKMLRHESETWILQRILRYRWMLIYGSGDMDLAEVPEIHMDAETWIGDMDPETWILQRILRYKNAETWIRRRWRGSCRASVRYKDAEAWIRRRGSCSGSWDTYGCWAMNPATWILQRILRCTWMLRHESRDMDLAEEPETQRCWDMNPKMWIL